MGFKNWLALFFMVFCAWAVVATSMPRESLNEGAYYIVSDCVTPTREATITVSSDQIATPPATSFTDFGFPTASVIIGQETSGTVGAATRICSPTYGDEFEGSGDWIFSCFDDGAPACTILIQKL
jgi:hypothetical protein